MSKIILVEQSSAPAQPDSTNVAIYVDNTATPQLKMKDDANTVTTILDNANTVAGITNKTFTGAAFTAGTTSVAPLNLNAGTNLTSATAGAIEYDGTVFYSTHAAGERGVASSEQFISLTATYTLTSQQAAQKMFNSPTNGQVTVASSTSYWFECQFDLSSMSGSSGSFGFALGGTATLTSVKWMSNGNKATLATAASGQSTMNTSAANTTIVTATTATVGWAQIEGIVRINAGGTLIPQISLGVAAAAVVGVNSYFRIRAIGTNTVVSVGNWT